MQEAKHTPGPWVALYEPGHSTESLTDNGGYRIDAPDDNVTQLAFVWVLNQRLPGNGRPQSEGPNFGDVRAGANARLIAAAPDLLAFAEYVSAMDPGNPAPLFERARAAIAKATAQRDG